MLLAYDMPMERWNQPLLYGLFIAFFIFFFNYRLRFISLQISLPSARLFAYLSEEFRTRNIHFRPFHYSPTLSKFATHWYYDYITYFVGSQMIPPYSRFSDMTLEQNVGSVCEHGDFALGILSAYTIISNWNLIFPFYKNYVFSSNQKLPIRFQHQEIWIDGTSSQKRVEGTE